MTAGNPLSFWSLSTPPPPPPASLTLPPPPPPRAVFQHHQFSLPPPPPPLPHPAYPAPLPPPRHYVQPFYQNFHFFQHPPRRRDSKSEEEEEDKDKSEKSGERKEEESAEEREEGEAAAAPVLSLGNGPPPVHFNLVKKRLRLNQLGKKISNRSEFQVSPELREEEDSVPNPLFPSNKVRLKSFFSFVAGFGNYLLVHR